MEVALTNSLHKNRFVCSMLVDSSNYRSQSLRSIELETLPTIGHQSALQALPSTD